MVAGLQIENVSSDQLQLDRIPESTRKAFEYLAKHPVVDSNHWYLAGGTALALQVGHRQSVDLDFFTSQQSFNETSLTRDLINTEQWHTTLQERGTLYGEIFGTQVSFIAYPFFAPSDHQLQFNSIRILTPADIAAMKIIAISQRGRKRDFIDLYWYCQNNGTLNEVINAAIKQYPNHNQSVTHLLKSLVYFNDAEKDPMPTLFFTADWPKVKAFFLEQVPKSTHQLLSLN